MRADDFEWGHRTGQIRVSVSHVTPAALKSAPAARHWGGALRAASQNEKEAVPLIAASRTGVLKWFSGVASAAALLTGQDPSSPPRRLARRPLSSLILNTAFIEVYLCLLCLLLPSYCSSVT